MGIIAHVLGITRSVAHDRAKVVKRSTYWPALRDRYLKTNPACAACGGTALLQVHHVIPVHEDPTLELDPSNLITLCAFQLCHLHLGHGGGFGWYVPDIRKIVTDLQAGRIQRPQAMVQAMAQRRPNKPGT